MAFQEHSELFVTTVSGSHANNQLGGEIWTNLLIWTSLYRLGRCRRMGCGPNDRTGKTVFPLCARIILYMVRFTGPTTRHHCFALSDDSLNKW